MLQRLFRPGETEPNLQEHAPELLPNIDVAAKNAALMYQDMVVDELMANPNFIFDNHWGAVTPRLLTLSGSVHKETGVWLNHEQLGFAHLQGRQKSAIELVTQRILQGDPDSERTRRVVGLVRDEMISNNQNVAYDLFCHKRLEAAVDQLASGEDAKKFESMLEAYSTFVQTPDRIWRDTSPARSVVLEGIVDYNNIATFRKSPSGETIRKMARLKQHYANVSEDDELFNRDRVLVERLQTIVGWQYTKALKELELQKFSSAAANRASLLSGLCKQLNLAIPDELERFVQDLASPAAAGSKAPSVNIANFLPNGLADIEIRPDGSGGRFGSKLVVAVLTASVVGGAMNFAPAVGAITVNYNTQDDAPSIPAKEPIALDFPDKKVKQKNEIKQKNDLVAEDQASAEITPPEETEPEVSETQADESPPADELLPLEPIALQFPEDSTAEDFLRDDVNPSEGIAVPTPEQEIREQAIGAKGRSREKLDAEFDQIAQANYATGETVAGEESHKAAQDAFNKAITYLDTQQEKREASLTDEEKLAQQTDMYWLLTGHARVVLNNPEVVIDETYLQELKDIIEAKQAFSDEDFMIAITRYWADEKNGFTALADLEQSGYSEDQLKTIRTLLAWAAFDALSPEDKAAILKNYGDQPEPIPEQQPANDHADKQDKPNKEKEEKDPKGNRKDKDSKQETKQGDYETDNDQIRKQAESIVDKLDRLEPYKKRFVADIATGALRAERDGAQINVEVTIAQAVLESGWGRSGLASKHNNIFGMKAGSDWDGPTTVISTTEFDSDGNSYVTDATWRVYPNIEASVKDYAHSFIGAKEWYADAQWFADNPSKYIDGLISKVNKHGKVIIPQGEAGAMSYATDPDYKPKLLSMVSSYKLREIADINKHDRTNRQENKGKSDKAGEKSKKEDKKQEPKTSLAQQILDYPGVDEIVSETDTGTPLPNELRQVVYYSQWDERWANKAYNWPGGEGRTISSSGCGPSSQAIVISTLSDKRVTPVDMAEWNLKNKYRVNGGTSHAALIESARAFGLEAGYIDDGIEGIRTAVRNGKLVIVNGTDTDRNTPATDKGHIYVVSNIAPNGDFIVSDPNSITKSLEQFNPADIAHPASVAVAVGR